MADLPRRLLLSQSSVSKRVKLEDPSSSQQALDLNEDDRSRGGVTFSASNTITSFSSSSSSSSRRKRSNSPVTSKGTRRGDVRISSHGVTPEILSHLRKSKMSCSSSTKSNSTKLSLSAQSVDSTVSPRERMEEEDDECEGKGVISSSSSVKLTETDNVEWRILPCLNEVIPGDLRKSVLATSAELMSSVQSEDKLISPFPKVSRASSHHSRPLPSYSGRRLSLSSLQEQSEVGSHDDHEKEEEEEKRKRRRQSESHGLMLWKRRRGKFAVSSQSDITSYMWMPFLNILREQPDYPEFIYLQPGKTSSSAFDPYDLDIVSHSEISSPYFYTMSSEGVTLYRDLDAEFSPLDEWENDFEYYKCIMKLNVFKQYKLWKGFKIWRRYVRKTLQGICRKALIKQLFSVNPILQRVLLQICQVSLRISVLHLFDYKKDVIYHIEEFLQLQQIRRQSIIEALTEHSEKAVVDVRGACLAVLSKIEEDLLGQQNEETEISTGAPNKPTSQSKSSRSKLASVAAKWKQEKEKAAEAKESQERFTFAIAAAKRNERQRLLKFLRLADYMIAQCLRIILIRSFVSLLHDLCHPSLQGTYLYMDDSTTFEVLVKKELLGQQADAFSVVENSTDKSGPTKGGNISIFEVTVVIHEDKLKLYPDVTEFLKQMEEFWQTIPDGLRRVRRLVSHSGLNGVVDQMNFDNEASVSYMELIGDKQLGDIISVIKSSIELWFQDADSAIKEFQPFLDIYIENQSITINWMRAEVKEGRWDIAQFRKQLDSFLQQVQDINGLPNSSDEGVLHINNKKLKESLLPSPQRCLQAIFTLIPELVSQYYQTFISKIHSATKKLLTKPSSVEEFVEIANFLQMEEAQYDELQEVYNEVEMKKALWCALEDFGNKRLSWIDTHFEKLGVEDVEEVVQSWKGMQYLH